MIRKIGPALATAALFAGLAAIGYWMLFSNLAVYDDEGYILISAREYFAHGGLYEFVYSQYGPAFYVLADAFQRLAGWPIDHTSARLLTLGLWLGTAGCCAGLVQRQTASRILAGFTLVATFLYLYFIIDEPFHPGSLIIFLLALSVWLTTELVDRGQLASAAAFAGCTGAVLALTKINVGAFYVVSAGAWILLQTRSARMGRGVRSMVVGLLVLFAAALMHTLWRETWVQIYLVLFATGAVTLATVLRSGLTFKARHAVLFGAGGAITALLILGLVWMRGTSIAGLVDGVLLGPARHPASYSYPVDWRPGSLLVAGLSLLLAGAHPWIQRRFSERAADQLIVALRLTQAAGLLVGLILLMNFRVVGAIFTYVAPLIWTWVVPLQDPANPRPATACRGLLATVLLLQYLHGYPIGGSQESWGTFLFIPLVALGLGEIRDQCRRQKTRLAGWWPAVAAVLVTTLTAKAGWVATTAHERYTSRSALGLPGAENLRLPEGQRTACRILAVNAAIHGDQLFSLPGLFSFNLWTGLPTPTRKNTTLWFTLLSDDEQSAIIQSIERAAHPCLIVQESLVQLMRAGNIPMRGILHDFLLHNFTPVFRTEGFAFLVRTGRSVAPLGIARMGYLAAPDPDQARPDTRLELCLLNDGTPIAAIEACDLSIPAMPMLTLSSANAQATLVTVSSADQAMGPPEKATWPLRFKGLARLSLQFRRTGAVFPATTTVFYLKDARGRIVSEARINE